MITGRGVLNEACWQFSRVRAEQAQRARVSAAALAVSYNAICIFQ